MKRIFLTSTLLISFLSFGQRITHLIEEETAQELKYEAEDSKGACDVFKPTEKKEKQECLEYWANRVRIIKKQREDGLKDLSTYYQNKEILMNKIKLAHDHILEHPQDSSAYYEDVKICLKSFIKQLEKCVNNYSWGEKLQIITIEKDPKTVFKVTIRQVRETDFR